MKPGEPPKHRHVASCWQVRLKCGKREHTAHTGNCKYDEKRKRYRCGGIHVHEKKCYKKVLQCRMHGTKDERRKR